MEYKRLKDFADECGVTMRSIQRHVQRHESELSGHIKRHPAPKGTYLDDFAQAFIRDHLLRESVAIVDDTLQKELEETRGKLLAAQEQINTLLREKLELTQQLLTEKSNLALADANLETLREKLEQETNRADTAEEITAKLKSRGLWARITRKHES